LIKIAELNDTRLVIISGRSLNDLEGMIQLPHGIEMWGSHGLERRRSDGTKVVMEVNPNVMKGLQRGREACGANINAAWCEVKPYSIALHQRGEEQSERVQDIQTIRSEWEKICLEFPLEIHIFDGGIELRTHERNKGDAVEELLAEMKGHGSVAYLGDDLTDEEAFKALGDRGLKVLVRAEWRPTVADIQLIPPEELLTFLDLWVKHGR
jgi:trehalose-phosphatase